MDLPQRFRLLPNYFGFVIIIALVALISGYCNIHVWLTDSFVVTVSYGFCGFDAVGLGMTSGLDGTISWVLLRHCAVIECYRDEIARCLEKAYEKIAFSEARRMLFFDTDQLMLDYRREVRNSYSRKKHLQQQQQLEPRVHHDRCDAEKMMRVYAKKVSPICVPCPNVSWCGHKFVLYVASCGFMVK